MISGLRFWIRSNSSKKLHFIFNLNQLRAVIPKAYTNMSVKNFLYWTSQKFIQENRFYKFTRDFFILRTGIEFNCSKRKNELCERSCIRFFENSVQSFKLYKIQIFLKFKAGRKMTLHLLLRYIFLITYYRLSNKNLLYIKLNIDLVTKKIIIILINIRLFKWIFFNYIFFNFNLI